MITLAPPPPREGTRTAMHCPRDTHNHGTELAMKVVRQAWLEPSGGSTPDLLRTSPPSAGQQSVHRLRSKAAGRGTDCFAAIQPHSLCLI